MSVSVNVRDAFGVRLLPDSREFLAHQEQIASPVNQPAATHGVGVAPSFDVAIKSGILQHGRSGWPVIHCLPSGGSRPISCSKSSRSSASEQAMSTIGFQFGCVIRTVCILCASSLAVM